MEEKSYIAIDLKSFYASVECVERGLDPLDTNLVVADASRSEKTVCLAVTPPLKAYGISGRARLFEVVEKVRQINGKRKYYICKGEFCGSSYSDSELKSNLGLSLDYIAAPPRMALYMEYSARIYKIYLKYVSYEDIHVYSVDEVFIDVTNYLKTYKMTAHELAVKMMRDVKRTTGITATAGIGTNMYLCKVAMDIVAKRMPADKDGVRIAELDEMSYRRLLWTHTPITDFWRVGRGYSDKLQKYQMYTMGDVALCSIANENLLYKLFGVNAELLIDHAWGYESCTIADIRAYKPSTNSISMGQVLTEPYSYDKARIIVKEMAEALSLDLVEKGLVTDSIVLSIGYDIENLKDRKKREKYKGQICLDHYGREVPKHGHGTGNLSEYTASTRIITQCILELLEKIADKELTVRRINICAGRVIREGEVKDKNGDGEQMDLFTDYEELERQRQKKIQELEKEKRMQKTVINIKKRYGKNAILRGTNFLEGATARDRNRQIGGHKA